MRKKEQHENEGRRRDKHLEKVHFMCLLLLVVHRFDD